MANTVINTPELLNLDSTTGATVLAKGTVSERPTGSAAIDGALRFNTDTNKTEYFDGTGWYEIVDEYASGFVGPATNYFDTKLYTGNGTTQSIGGYINGAGSFNGSSSKIDLGNNSSNNTATLSVSLWFKTAGHSGTATLINNGGSNSGETGYYLGLNSNGTIKFEAGTGTVNGAVNYADSDWHQIVLTLNSGAYNIYVDGNTTPVITGSGAFTTTATRPTWIGQFSYTASNLEFFNGSIDQVRLYNAALSASDVAALNLETATTATTAAFPSGQTATATYTMDTSANGLLTTTDLSTVDYPSGAGCIALYEMNGNSNDTSNTYNGTPTNITYEGGAFDQAAVFNGSSSYITADKSMFGTGDGVANLWSISLWFKTDGAVTASRTLIGTKGSSTQSGFFLYMISGGQIRYYEGNTSGNSQQLTTTATYDDGNWHNIVITRGGTTDVLTMYIDGTEIIAPTTMTNPHTSHNFNLHIGRYPASAIFFWDGSIDQVRIFNTALTQSQVTTLARGIATSYSGSATNVNFNGHLDFTPGLTWVKARDAAHDHVLVDSVNGAGSNKGLSSNAAYYEGQYTATYGYISSLNSNGFTVSAGSSYANYTNVNNEDYVSWNWKAGGTAVAGTGTGVTNVSVSANKDAGFSIVKYTGGNSASDTVNHGLTDAEMIFVKDLNDGTNNWRAWHKDLTSGYWLYLNLTNAQTSAATDGGIRNVDSNSFGFINGTTGGVEGVNSSASNYIAYVWKSVAGYSSIGSYAGNSSTNKITLDFAPSWVMIKCYDVAGSNWFIYDNKRNPANPADLQLEADTSAADHDTGTAYELDFLSDGFELQGAGGAVNYSGRNYLYMAIA